MARRVFLHVGPPKTGTSFLQAAWFQHRADLAEQGVLYPGDQLLEQFRASAVALDKTRVIERLSAGQRKAWERLLTATQAWEGTAILSSEHWSLGSRANAARTLERLATVADEVHVVATARDLARQIPAAWQQSVKQGNEETFEEYWRSLAADESRGFWQTQDLPQMLSRWSQGLPPERVHLVTHARPGASKGMLWERMCEVTGVNPDILRPVARANESLGVVHVELLRRINVELPDDRNRMDLGRLTKSFMTRDVLAPIDPTTTLALPDAAHAWLDERSGAMVENLRKRGYDVVGDLTDLLPAPAPEGARTPDSVTEAELAALAAPAMARMMLHEVDRRQRERRRKRQLRHLRRTLRGSGSGDDSLPERAARRARALLQPGR